MQQWSFNFGGPGFGFVNPEEIIRQQQQQLQELLNQKRCIVCKNTYTINDQITMCNYSKECVDNDNGQNCEHWEPLEINFGG